MPDQIIHVCAGPPICDLEDDDAIEECDRGCPFCTHILLRPDGSQETWTNHGRA